MMKTEPSSTIDHRHVLVRNSGRAGYLRSALSPAAFESRLTAAARIRGRHFFCYAERGLIWTVVRSNGFSPHAILLRRRIEHANAKGSRFSYSFADVITSKEELRSLMGVPSELSLRKEITWLHHHCRLLISRSPFLLISSSSSDGRCDVSPRGDPPGFVMVLDEKTLLIPIAPEPTCRYAHQCSGKSPSRSALHDSHHGRDVARQRAGNDRA